MKHIISPAKLKRTAVTAAIAVTATAGLVLAPTAAFATPAASDGSTDSPTRHCTISDRVIALWNHAPAELQEDLKELHGLAPDERLAAAKELKQGALDGEYGEGVQQRAERLRERRILVWATMPEALQDDLRELAAAEPGQRDELATEIVETALAGGYGDRAQSIAEHRQERCSE
jgi:hypothetical protein